MLSIYDDWELFGRFVCQYNSICDDGELEAFIQAWKRGQNAAIDRDWPEFKEFCEAFK